MAQKLYMIKRYYQNGRKPRVMRRDLTIEQAREHCDDPETSSKTASKACHDNAEIIARWDAKQKHWFDGFVEQ